MKMLRCGVDEMRFEPRFLLLRISATSIDLPGKFM